MEQNEKKQNENSESTKIDFMNEATISDFINSGKAQEVVDDASKKILGGIGFDMNSIPDNKISMYSSMIGGTINNLSASSKFSIVTFIALMLYVIMSGVLLNIRMFFHTPITAVYAISIGAVVFVVNKILKYKSKK